MSDATWVDTAKRVFAIVKTLEPIVGLAIPGIAPALSIATKIIQGAIDNEPIAVSLLSRINSGEVPTPMELQQYAAGYEASYQKLNASILAKLASTPT